VNGDADVGELAAEGVDGGQKVHARVLVGGQLQTAALEAAEFAEGAGGLAAEGKQAQGVVVQERPGCGEGAVAGGAVKEGFADGLLELVDDLADGGLGAVEADGGTGEAVLFGDGQKGFKLREFHKNLRKAEIR
jgi:hypothetical protein